LIDVGTGGKKIQRKIFTPGEIVTLLQDYKNKYSAGMLIMIYTSLRISELRALTKDKIDIEHRIIVGGIKTDAGKNRVIPIHRDIIPVLQWLIDTSPGAFLIDAKDSTFRAGMKARLAELNLPDHTSHDCRHTFFSIADRDGLNPTTIKIIGGHASFETTEKIYIHRNPSDLVSVIDQMSPKK